PAAHRTLRLRSFYRLLRADGRDLSGYYSYLAGDAEEPFDHSTKRVWERALDEAIQLEIGTTAGTRQLHEKVAAITENRRHWVLIGGPPCQAYSVVGRVRNKGIKHYKPEDDTRHFLYTHYLELIRRFRPSVFVMENVKGILSSNVSGTQIFSRILEDLRNDPGGKAKSGAEPYRIFSLAEPDCVYDGSNGAEFDPHDFVVRSELYGIPQTRHRVILVGIRGDLECQQFDALRPKDTVTVDDAIGDLPPLRSGVSRKDSAEAWKNAVMEQAKRVVATLPGSVKGKGLVKSDV